jgi:hypothetical protein
MYYLCSTFVPLSITTDRFLFVADSTALSAACTGVSQIPPRLSFTGLLALTPAAGQQKARAVTPGLLILEP